MNEQQVRAIASVLNHLDRAISDGLTFSVTVTNHTLTDDGTVVAFLTYANELDAHVLRVAVQ